MREMSVPVLEPSAQEGEAVSDYVNGVDCSHHNGVVDWQKVAASGTRFAYAKATEGLTFTDSKFQSNYTNMKAAGLLRGAYHFFRPESEPLAQADAFLAQVPARAGGDP